MSLKKFICRFHRQAECTCNYPIINTRTLIERLEHHIRRNNNLNKYERNKTAKDERNEETLLFENRLKNLKE